MLRFVFHTAIIGAMALASIGLAGCGQPESPVSAEEHYEGDGHDHSHDGHDHEGHEDHDHH
jgi:hypothetical protein